MKNRSDIEVLSSDSEPGAEDGASKKLVKDFIDLTLSSDPPRMSPGPAVVHDNNVKALMDTLRIERCKEVFSRVRDPCRGTLDAGELQVVNILTVKDRPDTELEYYRTIREWVYVNVLRDTQFRVLRPQGWLTDAIINAYATFLNKRNGDIINSQVAFQKRCIPSTPVFNTFFFENMKGRRKGEIRNDGVMRRTTPQNMDIFAFDLPLFPINILNKHWVLGYVDLAFKALLYLDSRHANDTFGDFSTRKNWIIEETKDKKGSPKANSLKVRSWKTYINTYRVLREDGLKSSFRGSDASNGEIRMYQLK